MSANDVAVYDGPVKVYSRLALPDDVVTRARKAAKQRGWTSVVVVGYSDDGKLFIMPWSVS